MFTLSTEMHADCFAGGEFETIVRDPILHTVYTQLHKSLCMGGGGDFARIQRAKSSTNNDASHPFKTLECEASKCWQSVFSNRYSRCLHKASWRHRESVLGNAPLAVD